MLGGHVQKSGEKWGQGKKRETRKYAISNETKEEVKKFFLMPEVSRENPCKKEVMKIKDDVGTSLQPKYTMIMTMKEAFDTFGASNSHVKIGFTSFMKCKPQNVRRVSETNRHTCLCQKCSKPGTKMQKHEEVHSFLGQ